MFDYSTIKQQVIDYISEYERDFDIDAIMDELRDVEPEIAGIDDLDQDDFTAIVERHDVSAQ